MSTPNARHGDPDFPDENTSGLAPNVRAFPSSEVRGDLEPLPYDSTVEPLDDEEDSLSKFPSERPEAVAPRVDGARKLGLGRGSLTIGLALLAVVQLGVIVALVIWRPTPPSTKAAAISASTPLLVESAEPGAQVLVDGQPIGVTPLKLDITSATRSIRVAAPSLEIQTPPSASRAVMVGQLQISSNPDGARVTIDGTQRGVTPMMAVVSPGSHTVQILRNALTSTRKITVAAGTTADLVVSFEPSGAAAGWVAIAVPFEVQVNEAGTLVGTSAARLMLPVGRHDLELTNTAIGFRATVPVDIQGDKTVTMTVPVPNGTVSINALPWANVFLDGRPLGATPIANLEVPLGAHEVIWRHPQLAERRQTVVVTSRSPLRLVMDLNK
jgi:PEGA domain